MDAPEKLGAHIDGELLAGGHVVIELHRADLDDLSPEMDGELFEDGGVGAHGLIPFQVQNDIIHGMLFQPFVKRTQFKISIP